MLSNLGGQRRGYDGHDSDGVLGHCALLDAACADVIQKQNAHLVAGHQLVGAVRALHGDTDAVRIGVGGEHQIGADFLGQFKTLAESLKDLGVGIRAGGEVAVGILLLLDDGDIGDAHILQNAGNGHKACAV